MPLCIIRFLGLMVVGALCPWLGLSKTITVTVRRGICTPRSSVIQSPRTMAGEVSLDLDLNGDHASGTLFEQRARGDEVSATYSAFGAYNPSTTTEEKHTASSISQVVKSTDQAQEWALRTLTTSCTVGSFEDGKAVDPKCANRFIRSSINISVSSVTKPPLGTIIMSASTSGRRSSIADLDGTTEFSTSLIRSYEISNRPSTLNFSTTSSGAVSENQVANVNVSATEFSSTISLGEMTSAELAPVGALTIPVYSDLNLLGLSSTWTTLPSTIRLISTSSLSLSSYSKISDAASVIRSDFMSSRSDRLETFSMNNASPFTGSDTQMSMTIIGASGFTRYNATTSKTITLQQVRNPFVSAASTRSPNGKDNTTLHTSHGSIFVSSSELSSGSNRSSSLRPSLYVSLSTSVIIDIYTSVYTSIILITSTSMSTISEGLTSKSTFTSRVISTTTIIVSKNSYIPSNSIDHSNTTFSVAFSGHKVTSPGPLTTATMLTFPVSTAANQTLATSDTGILSWSDTTITPDLSYTKSQTSTQSHSRRNSAPISSSVSSTFISSSPFSISDSNTELNPPPTSVSQTTPESFLTPFTVANPLQTLSESSSGAFETLDFTTTPALSSTPPSPDTGSSETGQTTPSGSMRSYTTGIRLSNPTPIITSPKDPYEFDDYAQSVSPGLAIQLYEQRAENFTVSTNGVSQTTIVLH